MVTGISLWKGFWMVNTWRAPVRKRLKRSRHIFNRLLHKTVPAFFLIMSYSFYITITPRVFKAYFAWKQLIVDYSMKRRKSRARFCLSLGWRHVSEKNMENCNSVCAGAHKEGKLVSFDPTLTLMFRYLERAKR